MNDNKIELGVVLGFAGFIRILKHRKGILDKPTTYRMPYESPLEFVLLS